MMLASMAATILRLEGDAEVLLQEDSESDLSRATSLFSAVLDGSYDSSGASFRIDQRKIFRASSRLSVTSHRKCGRKQIWLRWRPSYKSRFPRGNEPHLARNTFNVVLRWDHRDQRSVGGERSCGTCFAKTLGTLVALVDGSAGGRNHVCRACCWLR